MTIERHLDYGIMTSIQKYPYMYSALKLIIDNK